VIVITQLFIVFINKISIASHCKKLIYSYFRPYSEYFFQHLEFYNNNPRHIRCGCNLF